MFNGNQREKLIETFKELNIYDKFSKEELENILFSCENMSYSKNIENKIQLSKEGKIVQDADAIYREEIANAGLDKTIGQYFAALTNMRSVGVMGDERTYDYAIALRAVNTIDFMTAEWARIPYDLLDKISTRIVNEVANINRICYDITSKPPSTIEWE